MKSWISPKAQKGLPSSIDGKGLFAVADIAKDEIIAVKNGDILTLSEVESLPFKHLHPEMQIADDLFICPKTEAELEESMGYVNHSCDPNMGMRGDIVAVAMRDIKAGEEITQDYATSDARDYSFSCHCGSAMCRKVIRGDDWMKKELQDRYKEYFSAYIQGKMKGA